MIELHFVGFNGYRQFPNNEVDHRKVIKDWTSVVVDGTVVSCSHRFISLETEKFLKIYGVLINNMKTFNELPKPARNIIFGSCDEFLFANERNIIWKYHYRNQNWAELVFSFVTKEEKSLWEETENSIVKFSFQEKPNSVILLLRNGRVWLLTTEDCLKLLYPGDLDKAIDISSGLEHSLILTESGCVLSFGNGSRGQLGHGDLESTSQPVQIASLEGLKVTKIEAGGWHSCAITDSGDLYTWGWNNCGQLSVFEDGKQIGLTALPVLVDIGEEAEVAVIDVACGRRHTLAILDNGNLYSTGWNKYSQLGIGMPNEKISRFTKCTIQRGKDIKVICGSWYTILIDQSSEKLKKGINKNKC